MKLMNRMHRLGLMIVTAAAIMLSACAGVQAPQTFQESALAAATTVKQIQQTATSLLQAKKISVADAENVLSATDTAAAGIRLAETYAATDPAAGQSKLTAVVTVLTAIQAHLATLGAK